MDRPAKKASYIDLFDRIQDPLLIVNEEGMIIDANPGAEVFFNKPIGQLVNSYINFLFETDEQMLKELRVVLRRYHPRVSEKSITLNDTLKHLKIESCQLELENNNELTKVVQVLIKDQTELVEAKKLLEEKNKELAEISITDKLTSLFNRRHFDDCLEKEGERSLRGQNPLSVILFDVDKFKVYNDTNGHAPGDKLLRELASVVKSNIRNIDIACRYGGEEFVVICPNTGSEQALILAERIRLAVMHHDFEFKEKQPLGFISVSIGISSIPEHTQDIKEMLVQADEALYLSKENGRNRTTIFQKS